MEVKHKGITVTLGGKAWVLAALPPSRYRIVIPLLCGLLDAIGKLAEMLKPQEQAEGEQPNKEQQMVKMLTAVSDLFTEKMIDDLALAFFTALGRNYPELTAEEWNDETAVSVMEMIAAFPALAQQAGLMPASAGGVGGGTVGEAIAGT